MQLRSSPRHRALASPSRLRLPREFRERVSYGKVIYHRRVAAGDGTSTSGNPREFLVPLKNRSLRQMAPRETPAVHRRSEKCIPLSRPCHEHILCITYIIFLTTISQTTHLPFDLLFFLHGLSSKSVSYKRMNESETKRKIKNQRQKNSNIFFNPNVSRPAFFHLI